MSDVALPWHAAGTFIPADQTEQNERILVARSALVHRPIAWNGLNRMARYAFHAGRVAAAVFVLVASIDCTAAAEPPLIEQSADGLVTLNIFGIPLHFTKDDVNSLEIAGVSCNRQFNLNHALIDPHMQACFLSALDERGQAYIRETAEFFPNKFNSPAKPQPFLGFITRDSIPTGSAEPIVIIVAAVGKRLQGGGCDLVCPGFAYAGLVGGFPEYKREYPSPFASQEDASLFVIPTADFRDGRPSSKHVFCKFEVAHRVCFISADSDDSRVGISLSWDEKNAGPERWLSLIEDFKRMVDFIFPSYKGRMK